MLWTEGILNLLVARYDAYQGCGARLQALDEQS